MNVNAVHVHLRLKTVALLHYVSATRPDNFLIFTDSTSKVIFRMDLTTHSFVLIPLYRSGNPIAIDYDPVDGRIYWTDVVVNEIHSITIDGQDQRVENISEAVSSEFNHVNNEPRHKKTICENQRCRSACTSAQSDQHICCSLPR